MSYFLADLRLVLVVPSQKFLVERQKLIIFRVEKLVKLSDSNMLTSFSPNRCASFASQTLISLALRQKRLTTICSKLRSRLSKTALTSISTHKHAIQLLVESADLVIDTLRLLGKLQIVLLGGCGVSVPECDDPLCVVVIGGWCEVEIQLFYDFFFQHQQLFQLKSFIRNFWKQILSQLASDDQTGNHKVLKLLYLHFPALLEVQIDQSTSQDACLTVYPLFGCLTHHEGSQSLSSRNGYGPHELGDRAVLQYPRVHAVGVA